MLTADQLDALRHEARRSGLSMGELVRRAVDKVYRPESRRRFRGFELSTALWRDPDAAVVGRRVRPR
jgi:hypothetical protein